MIGDTTFETFYVASGSMLSHITYVISLNSDGEATFHSEWLPIRIWDIVHMWNVWENLEWICFCDKFPDVMPHCLRYIILIFNVLVAGNHYWILDWSTHRVDLYDKYLADLGCPVEIVSQEYFPFSVTPLLGKVLWHELDLACRYKRKLLCNFYHQPNHSC